MLLAVPFKGHPHRLNALRLARIGCFLHTNDLASATNLARTIILQNQFQSDALRLLQALVPAGQAAVEVWNMSTLQKFTMRQLRLIDEVAMGKAVKVGREGQVMRKDEKEGEKERKKRVEQEGEGEEGVQGEVVKGLEGRFMPTRSNPVFHTVYAGMLLTSRSFQSAISKWDGHRE